MTNLQVWAKAARSSEKETFLALIRRQWEIDEMIKASEVPPIPDFNLQESILGIVESSWLECDDEDLLDENVVRVDFTRPRQ